LGSSLKTHRRDKATADGSGGEWRKNHKGPVVGYIQGRKEREARRPLNASTNRERRKETFQKWKRLGKKLSWPSIERKEGGD